VRFQAAYLVGPAALTALLCAGALIVALSSPGARNSAPEQFGRAMQQIMNRPDDARTVALVDTIAISQRELDIEITARQFGGRSTDRTTALESLIEHRLLLAEALSQGIAVSDGELGAFVATQREVADQDPQRNFYGYAAALGLTEISIWSYRPLLEAWRRHLVIGKLKAAVLGEVTQDTVRAKEAQWATYIDDLRVKAQVVVK
jgi:hypothetical protein